MKRDLRGRREEEEEGKGPPAMLLEMHGEAVESLLNLSLEMDALSCEPMARIMNVGPSNATVATQVVLGSSKLVIDSPTNVAVKVSTQRPKRRCEESKFKRVNKWTDEEAKRQEHRKCRAEVGARIEQERSETKQNRPRRNGGRESE